MQQSSNNNNSGNSRTIFLAEDDIDDQEFLREALLAIDPLIELVCFRNGIKFINGISQLKDGLLPELIILDYNIPEINGAEILERLKDDQRYDGIPKIVWSTSDSQLYRQDCLSFGAVAYLVKPSSVSGIREIAKQMLEFCQSA